MSSGVKVSEDAKKLVDTMTVHLTKDDKNERYKMLFFTIDDNEGEIVVDRNNMVKVKDLANKDVFKVFQEKILSYNGCYAVYDCEYETKEFERSELIHIMWTPDSSPIKIKMKYASSKDAFRRAVGGSAIKHNWEINDEAEIKDKSFFVDKLGKPITKLEGMDVK